MDLGICDAHGALVIHAGGVPVPAEALRRLPAAAYHGLAGPAYTIPDAATGEAIMRVVIRKGLSYDLADDLIGTCEVKRDLRSQRQPAADLDRIARL